MSIAVRRHNAKASQPNWWRRYFWSQREFWAKHAVNKAAHRARVAKIEGTGCYFSGTEFVSVRPHIASAPTVPFPSCCSTSLSVADVGRCHRLKSAHGSRCLHLVFISPEAAAAASHKGQRVEVFIVAGDEAPDLERMRRELAKRGVTEADVKDAIAWARGYG